MHRNLSIRRLNSNARTLRIALPSQYVDEHGLSEGDQCVWTEEGDSVRLTFVRLSDVAAERAAPRQEAQTESAAPAAV
jgi:hypothetical protein